MKKINNWTEVDKVLKELCDIQRDITTCENDLNEKVNKIKNAANDKIISLTEKKEKLIAAVENYTLKNKDEFEKNRSKDLTFGVVGFRKSSSIVYKNINDVIEKLKKLKMTDCLKVVEKVNTSMLGTYEDKILKKVGASRETKDTFYYQLKMEGVKK